MALGNSRTTLWITVFFCLVMLSACGSGNHRKKRYPRPLHPVNEVLRKDVIYPVDVYDPWEKFNRRMYKFNYSFDKYLLLPMTEGYEYITPNIIEKAISNIFSNLKDIRNFINATFQLKGKVAGKTAIRFITNTTVGLGGIWDPATKYLGIYKQNEDFGQTLGHYDVGHGPYVVLPVLGPSSARDGSGFIVDTAIYFPIDPVNVPTGREYQTLTTEAEAIDKRHKTSFRYFETGSPFEYEMVRFLYFKMRELEIKK